jgi:hypothetical protein
LGWAGAEMSTIPDSEIDEPIYQIFTVINSLENLKRMGFVEGGRYTVPDENMERVLRVGKERGYSDPTIQQMAAIIEELNK